MIGRKSIIGLCLLCALAISAFAAQSASAVFTGTTAFTCKAVAEGGETTKGFKDEHCKEPVGDGKTGGKQVKFEHVSIANDTTTELTGTNEKTPGQAAEPTQLHVTLGGVLLTLKATGVSGTGSMHNHLTGEEHEATGTGTITYTGVTVVGHPECIVKDKNGGVKEDVKTEGLTASTKGVGDKLKFEPTTAGGPFATFWVEGAGCPITGVQKVFGTVISTEITGATTKFTESDTTTQGTLHYGAATGPKAGIDGLLTLKARLNSGEGYTPLAATTTP